MTSLFRPETLTGGSWKKSPESTTCMPPNGRGSRRMMRQTWSTMSNSQACIIETSSMTRMSVSWILRRRRDRMSLISGSVSAVATPMPLHEWMVWPLICVEAMPVDAVTATLAPSARALRMNSLSTYVLPAPGAPVRNTFAPAFRIAIASDCSMPFPPTPPAGCRCARRYAAGSSVRCARRHRRTRPRARRESPCRRSRR